MESSSTGPAVEPASQLEPMEVEDAVAPVLEQPGGWGRGEIV